MTISEDTQIIEGTRSVKSMWITEHNQELREGFVSENLNEFNEFMQEEIVDEDRTFDYWKMQFCEENEEDFNEFCERAFEKEK